MIRFVYANDLWGQFPDLAASMFRDRAEQFKNRLKWDVQVDYLGYERDEYDQENPLYIIWEKENGLHGGSMRFLPTTGRTMTNDHFSFLLDQPIQDAATWETTRFCIAPDTKGDLASLLMFAARHAALRFGVTQYLGVFDARMVRIYSRIGYAPKVLGSTGQGREKISVGIWHRYDVQDPRARSSWLAENQVQAWFDQSFPDFPTPQHAGKA